MANSPQLMFMATDKFTLMDFVKRQGLASITEVFGEECLNEDGTVMSLADQAAVITHYLKLQDNPEFVRTYEKAAKRFIYYWDRLLENEGTDIKVTANLTKYLNSETSFVGGVDSKIDTLRKENVTMMLSLLSEGVDVSEFDPHNFGIGYNELRYFSIDSEGNPFFESNNVHDWERGEDAYKVFVWEDLTDYEKPAIEDILKQIVKQKFAV